MSSFIEPFDHVNHNSICQHCQHEFWFKDSRLCVCCRTFGCDNCMTQCYCCSKNYSCECHMVVTTMFGFFDMPQLICIECYDRARIERNERIKSHTIIYSVIAIGVTILLLIAMYAAKK